MTDRVFRIEPVARAYAWGSPTAIPRLLGTAPSGDPIAELWFGAHPDSPSSMVDGPLDEVIANDPVGLLGSDVVSDFGERLPFLLKLLAADQPLSIQVHPNLAQARAGYAAEQAAGIAIDAPDRNYRDANHKPELLCALTEFDALCGFRPVDDTLRLIGALGVAELAPVAAALAGADPLRSAFALLLDWPADSRDALIAAVLEGCDRAGAAEWQLAVGAVRHAARAFAGDIGAVITLLLNAVRLQPGEAIFLGAGNVHAYLRGLGVEIMANSDNVLRCGLTPKHVDVAEVLKVADFTALARPQVIPIGAGPGEQVFVVAVPDFELAMLTAPPAARTDQLGGGPQIVLCTQGAVGVGGVELLPGQAVFTAAASTAALTGSGVVFVATTGSSAR